MQMPFGNANALLAMQMHNLSPQNIDFSLSQNIDFSLFIQSIFFISNCAHARRDVTIVN